MTRPPPKKTPGVQSSARLSVRPGGTNFVGYKFWVRVCCMFFSLVVQFCSGFMEHSDSESDSERHEVDPVVDVPC